MNDNEIGNAMRRLPRATPSPRFTSDVLRAVRTRQASRVVWRFAAVTAMVLMIIAGTYAAALRLRQERRPSMDAAQDGPKAGDERVLLRLIRPLEGR